MKLKRLVISWSSTTVNSPFNWVLGPQEDLTTVIIITYCSEELLFITGYCIHIQAEKILWQIWVNMGIFFQIRLYLQKHWKVLKYLKTIIKIPDYLHHTILPRTLKLIWIEISLKIKPNRIFELKNFDFQVHWKLKKYFMIYLVYDENSSRK